MTESTRRARLWPGRAAVILSLVFLVGAGGCDGSATETGRDGTETEVTLRRVVLSPKDPSVQIGGTVQFQVAGEMSDGSTRAVAVSYAATGGQITTGGVYTAGSAAGTFRVVAASQGGLADTAVVVVTASPVPPTPPQPGNYTTVTGEDWKRYAGTTQLRAANLFWWYRSENVNDHVDLVQDPTFGQVARIKFQQSDETGYAPKLDRSFPQPLDRVWYRWRMKFSPGWTSAGPLPTGYANSYKIAFWLWEGYEGRGEVEYTNTTEYAPFWNVKQPGGSFLQYTETVLPGSAANFGRVGTEWSDSEWYEFVIFYEKVGPTTARQHWWRRKLTSGGQIANNSWTYLGREFSGSTAPRVRGISLGANRNKSNPSTMYIYWGPWEVVDGSQYPNPFGMPNLSGGISTPIAPTLSRVETTPDSVGVAAGQTVQFQTVGRMSDGSITSVSVTYSATGGTVSGSGLYTAPSAAGKYQVFAREASSGKTDTSVVTVAATATPTLTRVVLTPATASVQTGGTIQFQAAGQYSDGSTKPIVATWSATGGAVTSSGLYTAGQTAGTFRVIAGGQGTTLADTSAVTVTLSTTTTPTTPTSYGRLAGDDWKSYSSKTALQGANYFSWNDSRSVYGYVDLVSDPTFGQVVRITQPGGSSSSPQLTHKLPAATSEAWYRFRAKFSPGWTTSGSGTGSPTWVMSGWSWSAHAGGGSLGFQNANYAPGFNVRDRSTYQYLKYSESQLPGSTGLGRTSTEWSDGEWYEYVVYYEKTGTTSARQHWWKRKLTSAGQVVNNSWTYFGVAYSGSTTPQVGAVQLGVGNLGRAGATTKYVYWGPWEVVDGAQYRNPFGMAGF